MRTLVIALVVLLLAGCGGQPMLTSSGGSVITVGSTSPTGAPPELSEATAIAREQCAASGRGDPVLLGRMQQPYGVDRIRWVYSFDCRAPAR